MFQIEGHNRVIVMHRSGRLMRPSDRIMPNDGLGGVDGFLDVLKNFGSGIVKFASAGLYDPSKNRFYVPFSSGQMRNYAQGFVNTSTFGLVKTDKFFNSQTMKTIGAVAGGVAAAATAYAGGSYLMSKFGSGASNIATGSTGTNLATSAVKQVGGSVLKNVGPQSSAAPNPSLTPSAPTPSTSSMFTFDNATKALDLGTKVIGAVAGGGQQQVQPQYGSQGPVIMIGAQDPGMYPVLGQGGMPTGLPMYDPYMSGGVSPYVGGGGGGMTFAGGGGGGGPIGPPGSEYAGMDQQQMMPMEEEGMSTTTKAIVVGGSVLVLYYLLKKK